MEWSDQGIVLSSHPHGETASVAMLLTRDHGRHAGLIAGGRGKAARAAVQTGNRLAVRWRGRLAEQLGSFTWELEEAFGPAWLHDPARLAGIASACALVEMTLPEHEPHDSLFDGMNALLTMMGEASWPALYVRWECGLLAALGFGLDLNECASTGQRTDLVYVSPRSGRAVSREAGLAFHDKLLTLPAFLLEGGEPSMEEMQSGLALTGHFLERHVLGPHGKALPPARSRLVERLGA